MICFFLLVSSFFNTKNFSLKCKIFEESILRFPEGSFKPSKWAPLISVPRTIQVKMSFKSIVQKLAAKECYFGFRKQAHMSFFHQPLAAFWAKQRENLEEKKETFRARAGPLHIPFSSITSLILGHRCSFWMSDAAGRCFPLSPLSLPQSVYSCLPVSLHLQSSLNARPKGFFPPHTKGHFPVICSFF